MTRQELEKAKQHIVQERILDNIKDAFDISSGIYFVPRRPLEEARELSYYIKDEISFRFMNMYTHAVLRCNEEIASILAERLNTYSTGATIVLNNLIWRVLHD